MIEMLNSILNPPKFNYVTWLVNESPPPRHVEELRDRSDCRLSVDFPKDTSNATIYLITTTGDLKLVEVKE